MQTKQVVLSGMRPTGKLHIGHVESVLTNWKELQEKYACYFFVADWHALTTDLNTTKIKENSIEMVKDWLAYGITPEKSNIFLQSKIPEHAELHLIFSMLTNLGRLERVPSYKAQIQFLAGEKNQDKEELHKSLSYGFLGYPVLQAADILIYKTNYVPVGEDQLPHVELTREIARMFNSQYGSILVEPKTLLAEVPKILGIDGRKMSKSYHNDINPDDDLEKLTTKAKAMMSDPGRKRITDFGNPDLCSVFDLQKIYQDKKGEAVRNACVSAQMGCVSCKSSLAKAIFEKYESFRAVRHKITDDEVMQILLDGSKKARAVAKETLLQVRDAMKINYIE